MPANFHAARQFLATLGKPKGSVRLRGFYAKTDPRKADDKGAKGEPTKALVESWVADKRGVYVVINNGGDKDADITECIAFFCEWDDRPKDWQVTAWQELGLPEPTIQVDTGGKSIHNYWVLAGPIAPDLWRQIQSRLLDYADADRQLKNPSRVMRLPGTPHPETGELAQIIHLSESRPTATTFAACLPAPVVDRRHEQARTFTDYESQGLDEIQRALQAIPPRVPGGGTYPMYRNILWGLIAACEEAGGSADTAISMMAAHSPQWHGIDQVARSGGADVGAGTFWYWAKEHGYRAPRRIRQGPAELRANLPPESGRQPEPGPAETPVPEPDLEEPTPEPEPASSLPFRPLGFDRGTYFYLPSLGGQVVELTAAQHNKSHFLQLASLEWWAAGFGDERNRIDWDSAQNAIMGACMAQGVYNPDRIRGRGAWTDSSRVIFHLGNRLMIDGRAHPITKLPKDFQSYFFYENAKELLGPAAKPLDDDTAFKLRCIAERFRWETPASANMLLGWIVLAPVCGALDWRPHIWVTGGAGTGKTTVLKLFMKPLLGGIYQAATGGTTEAGLRGTLKSDAIPVVFDEFEQNEARDKAIVQNVLSLARIASSEGGCIIKGTTSGGANSFEVRSMFCVSSINVALFQKADLDRFCVLPLRKDHMPKDDWTKFEAEIIDLATTENGRALIARTLQQIPTIKANAKVLGRALAHRFGQRFGDQHGTLLAGAWSLEPDGGGVLTLEKAKQWIDQMDWETRDSDESDADEVKCRDTILQHLVDYSVGQKAQLGELVRCVAIGMPLRGVMSEELAQVLARWGLKVFRKGMDRMPGSEEPCGSHFVAVAHSNRQLAALFRDTPWANNAHRAALKRLPGSVVTVNSIYFAGVGTQRATLVPVDTSEG
jgi:putative DNA primase/helicase